MLGDTQAGATLPPPDVYAAARNNANMATLPDGSSSITNMYLWQPVAGAFYPPCVDGDYDAGIIGHEYTHMIENRMIGKGDQRSGFQAGAMGEAAGDLVAIEQLNENGLVPTGRREPVRGRHVRDGQQGPRHPQLRGELAADRGVPGAGRRAQVDPLNFSDVGYDLTGPEVHADGEIWVAINFELRRALAAKYNAQFPESDRQLQAQCAAGTVPRDAVPGQPALDPAAVRRVPAHADRTRRWWTRATRSSRPTRPGSAARTRPSCGRRSPAAASAASPSQDNTSGRVRGVESDTNPLPDFEAVGQSNATVTFATTVAGGGGQAAPKARIYVGHYEARVSPVADTDPTTNAPATASANNLDADRGLRARHVRVHRDGPGLRRGALPRDVPRPAAARRSGSRWRPNLASQTAGAAATRQRRAGACPARPTVQAADAGAART